MRGLSHFAKLMRVTAFAVSKVPQIGNDLEKVKGLISSINEEFDYLVRQANNAGVNPAVIIRDCCPGSESFLHRDLKAEIEEYVLRT